MRKRARFHGLLTPRSRVISVCLKPADSADRVRGAFANGQRFNLHRTQTGQEKRGRELFPIDLSIDLVRRFIDTQRFQAARQFFVADFLPPHLNEQHFPSLPLPFVPYVGWPFRNQFGWVQRHVRPELLGFCALVFNKSVLYDRKPMITPSVFLHESTGHLFGNTDAE